MAEGDDATEPSLAGGALGRVGRRTSRAARVGARVNVEGVRLLVAEYNQWLGVLRNVRRELEAINRAGAAGGTTAASSGAGGVGRGTTTPGFPVPPTGVTAGGLILPPGVAALSSPGLRAAVAPPGPPPPPAGSPSPTGPTPAPATGAGFGNWVRNLLGGMFLAHQGMAILGNRFNRNMQESIGISQANMLTASMYGGFNYAQGEMRVRQTLGNFAGNRQEAMGAYNTALRFGMSNAGAMGYLEDVVAPVVQASGGTINATQAAAVAGDFMDPQTMRRATALGITPAMQAGRVANPLAVAQRYIKDYERRYHVQLGTIDFENMRNPGSRIRYAFKRIYMLSDEAIDTVVQSGLQNAQFQTVTGGQADIDFSNPEDLEQIGMRQSRLGLAAVKRLSVAGTREARFFRTQEDAMVGRMNVENTIDETLGKFEDALGSVIGPLYELEKVVNVLIGAFSLVGLAGAVRGGGTGAGLIGSLFGARGGGGGVGTAPPTAPGGVGGVGAGAKVLGVTAGLGLAFAGSQIAQGEGVGAQIGGTALGIGGGALAGATIGSMVPIPGATAVGAVVGGVAGGALSVKNAADANYTRGSGRGEAKGMGLSETEMLQNMPDYTRTSSATIGGSTAGARQVGMMNVFQRRRGAMTAAMFEELISAGTFADVKSTEEATQISDVVRIVGTPEEIEDDDTWDRWHQIVLKWLGYARRAQPESTHKIYTKFFGDVSDPFAMQPVETAEARAMIVSSADILGATDQTGDGDFDKGTAKNTSGPSWDRLDPRLRSKLEAMFAASGGKVWLGAGGGWRSSEAQRSMFLARYTPDPKGEVAWNGQRWKHVKGAPAAPPGRSMHEIGLAADLAGDLAWVQQNAAKFGLKTFASVNNEPWHVQPIEIPNSRREYEAGGGGTETSEPEFLGDNGASLARSNSGSSANSSSGVNFNLESRIAGNFSLASPGTSAVAGGLSGGNTIAWGGAPADVSGGEPLNGSGRLSREQIAQVAYKAGFSGADLVNFVSVAWRESGGNPAAMNESWKTGEGNRKDMSYGLFQINLLPWLEKGQTPPWTKEQLLDPQFNANVAHDFFSQRGMSPWTIDGKWDANTDHAGAEKAVKSAGLLGDGSFDTGLGGSGSPAPTIVQHGAISLTFGDVNLVASGKLEYDAQQFAGVAMARAREAVEIERKRSGE